METDLAVDRGQAVGDRLRSLLGIRGRRQRPSRRMPHEWPIRREPVGCFNKLRNHDREKDRTYDVHLGRPLPRPQARLHVPTRESANAQRRPWPRPRRRWDDRSDRARARRPSRERDDLASLERSEGRSPGIPATRLADLPADGLLGLHVPDRARGARESLSAHAGTAQDEVAGATPRR